MYYTISHTTNYAYTILGQSVSGTIHSVYKKTINLVLNGQLLSLQAANSPVSPLSLITELDALEFESLDASPGQSFTISNSQILFSSCCFSFSHAQTSHTKLTTALSAKHISSLRDTLADTLRTSDAVGFQPLFTASSDLSSSPVLSAAKKQLLACDQHYSYDAYNLASESLVALLGLGIGLTPSGDDFLCGVLAGLQLLGMYRHPFSGFLRTEIKAHLEDTNDISAAFLTCALQNQYSTAINMLINSPSVHQITTTFADIGHSSGIDTLCGVLYAFQLCI